MRNRPALASLLAALASATTACETTQVAVEGSSCVRGDAAMCLDLVTVESGLVAQAICLDVIGPSTTFAAGLPCPLEGRVGSCEVIGPDARYDVVYYPPAFTVETGTADCSARGGAFRGP
jgi:hypothetical protein